MYKVDFVARKRTLPTKLLLLLATMPINNTYSLKVGIHLRIFKTRVCLKHLSKKVFVRISRNLATILAKR